MCYCKLSARVLHARQWRAARRAAVAFLAGGWDATQHNTQHMYMCVVGWDGDGGADAPGFPRDGSWTVRAEGFLEYIMGRKAGACRTGF